MLATVSNLGKWDALLAERPPEVLGPQLHPGPQPIAPSETYELGAAWLADCSIVEDWGCGLGWLRWFIHPDRYRGLDGSRTPFADEIVDLVQYRSTVPGIFMRHVLEHNYDWRVLLDNAVASFTQRMVLVLFTPMSDTTQEISPDNSPWIDVPNISFRHEDIVERFGTAEFTFEDVEGGGVYHRERVYYLEKR